MKASDRTGAMVVVSRLLRRVALSVLASSLMVAAVPPVAGASTTLFVTTDGSDANPCSQTAPCLDIAHALSVASTGDRIDVGPGQFAENLTIPQSLGSITINGSGANVTSVYGGLAGSVFTIDFGASATISNLNAGGGSGTLGGGVDSSGTVTLLNDIIAFNSAGFGGGIYQGPGGGLTVKDTSVFANQASPGNANFGGGGIAIDSAPANVVGSAIYRNSVSGSDAFGAGIWAIGLQNFTDDTIALNTATGGGGGGGIRMGDGTLDGDTIADNSAPTGGGVWSSGSGVEASDTIIAGNSGGNCNTGLGSGGYDLEDDAGASCGLSTASDDLIGVNPQLGSLAANGGPTNTIALAAGSPAIGHGNCVQVDAAAGADVDQRGSPRRFAQRGVCDIGAWDSGGALSGVIVDSLALPGATVGVPYRQALLASGGIGGPYTWSVAAGVLPAGLSLSSAGVISGTAKTTGTSSFTVEAMDSSKTATHAAKQPLSVRVYVAPTPAVWVANGANSEINAFALSANGDVAPIHTLSGPLTGLDGPDALVFDSVGNLYVANADTPAITEYQAGASGNVAPARTLVGAATGLVTPAGITLDSADNLYVANEAEQSVTVYPYGASGDVPPIRTITGPQTQLSQPWGLAIDAAGHLWVANYGASTLTEYAANANGDAAPLETIRGAQTQLDNPMGLAQDSAGDLIAANLFGNSVTEFPNAQPFGDENPSLSIGGAGSQLAAPEGVDVDAANRLYVANRAGVNVFAPRASVPTAIIASGPTSGIAGADALAVAPPLTIAATTLPTAALGKRYRQRLTAVLGEAPLRWRVLHGRLPSGLRLTETGVIRGTPNKVGTFHFTVTVHDSTRPAMSATHRISLAVRRTPVVSAILPSHGLASGNQRVRILGRNLATGHHNTTISFGRIRALGVVCPTHTRCIVRTPPHTAGSINLTVTVDGLASATTHVTRFHYRHSGR